MILGVGLRFVGRELQLARPRLRHLTARVGKDGRQTQRERRAEGELVRFLAAHLVAQQGERERSLLPQPFGGIGQAVRRGGHADRPERQRRERRGERDARDAAQPVFPWYLLHDRHLGTNLCDRRDGYSEQKYFGKAREGLDFALFFCIIIKLMVSP